MYAGKIILHILLSAVLFNRTPHCSSKLSLTFVTALPIPGFLRIHYLFDLILNCVFLFYLFILEQLSFFLKSNQVLCIKYFDANSFVFGRGKNWIMTKGND
jgi:hypothetical protein